MNCNILNNDLILYAEDSLPDVRKDHVESHLIQCSECREYLSFLRESLMIVEQDKKVERNPFLFTRIISKLEAPAEYRWSYSKKLIPAFAFSLILIAGILGGISMGRLYSGNTSGYSADLQEEIGYLNDIRQESIETFFLTSNDENNE